MIKKSQIKGAIDMIDLYYWQHRMGKKFYRSGRNWAGLSGYRSEYRQGRSVQTEFLAFSPNNRMPAIIDHDGPDGQPFQYLDRGDIIISGTKTGQLMPDDIRAQTQLHEWLVANGRVWAHAGDHHFHSMPRRVLTMRRLSLRPTAFTGYWIAAFCPPLCRESYLHRRYRYPALNAL